MNKKEGLDVSVVIPTYNEKENISALIKKIEGVLKRDKKRFEIVIVDDNSPDGTADIAKALNKRYRNIQVLTRKKKGGVGAAYYFGYKNSKGGIIIGMDADLSHNPYEIPKLLRRLEEGYDMVLGSRHMHGAYYEHKKFNTFRKYLTSKYGNILTSVILGIKIHDFTNGFRCFRREILQDINLINKGNSLLMEIIAKTYWNGHKIAEVPVTFMDRKKGTSKLRLLKEPIEFLGEVFQLKRQRLKSF